MPVLFKVLNFLVQPGPGLDENSPLPSPLPDKVHNMDNQSKAPVPKLDLSKAKKIQEQIAKKITQPQIQQANENPNPKYLNKINQYILILNLVLV